MKKECGEERNPYKKTEGKNHDHHKMQPMRATNGGTQHQTMVLQNMSETTNKRKKQRLHETKKTTNPETRTTCVTTVKNLHNKPIEQLLTTKPFLPNYYYDLRRHRPTRKEIIDHYNICLMQGETPEISAMITT